MPTPRNPRLLCALIGISLVPALVPAIALGQGSVLPNKIVRIIVPNEAAGPNDLTGRVIAPKLQEAIGQNVVVENRASANGVVGSQYVAHATPDGSVLAVGNSGTHAVNGTLYKNPTYDPVKDFAPISEVIFAPLLLVTNPSLKANNVKELIAEARANPGKINFAVAGATGEIAGDLIKMLGKVEINNIPYKGGAPAITAVMSNESQLVLTLYSSLKGPIDAGKLKALGVTSSKRDPQIPNVPTIAESGLDGYQVEFWVGLFAPAKTPAATVQALGKEVVRILNMPDVKSQFTKVGYTVVGSTPEQFAERVKRDTEKYRKVILDSGMTRLD
ncbi:MAG TPA: tripartite tricarboxylate transporter substrate binding protein [Burkholderiales bacterium]|nr:tripartite tricarboxylate transporter substrate binding protein [Burkholderiales bacterium]